MTNKKQKEKLITKTTVKKNYGFTEELIKTLLPAPKLVTNPHYKKAAPMQLFEEKAVIKATKRKAYIEHQERSAARKAGAKKAVDTKTKKLLAEMQECGKNITVLRVDAKEIRDRAVNEKRAIYEDKCIFDGYLDDEGFYPDDSTKDRWAVNKIRHDLSDYDNGLEKLQGKVGKDDAYRVYKSIVMNKIAAVYPEYANECNRQKP